MKKICYLLEQWIFVTGSDSDVGIPKWKPVLDHVKMQL